MRIDTDIDAIVPMLRIYSTCTGETLRNVEALRSRGLPVCGDNVGLIGTGT